MAEKNHKHVKDDDKYEALRGKRMSKDRAAKISNSPNLHLKEAKNILMEREKATNFQDT